MINMWGIADNRQSRDRSQPAQRICSASLSLLRVFSSGDVLAMLLLLAYTDKAPWLGRPDPDSSTPRRVSPAVSHCLPWPSESYRLCCWLPSFLSHQIQLDLIFSFLSVCMVTLHSQPQSHCNPLLRVPSLFLKIPLFSVAYSSYSF